MLSPGGKGWINKYFDLVENGHIKLKVVRPEGLRKLPFMHLTFTKCGIVFGYPLELIFAKNLDDSKWTTEEKLKLLLFESHLFIYTQIHNEVLFDREKFIQSLFEFYQFHNSKSIVKIFSFRKKIEVEEELLERVLAKRVDIKVNYLDNKWWVNSLSNAFTYLDVILFDDFEHRKETSSFKHYSIYANNALTAITLSAYSDGVIDESEKDMFNVFLASASLNDVQRDLAKSLFKKGAELKDVSPFIKDHWLLKRFLLDISTLTIFSNEEVEESEVDFLKSFCEYLEIPLDELDETMTMAENFILRSNDRVEFLKNKSSYEIVYGRLTKRWTKVILRNKDKLSIELKESKQLILLVKKSTAAELTKEEKDIVKTQFKDLAKSVPSLAIFMLPGGALLLPLILKIIPDLIPSAFRDNKIDNQD